ncbi:MAG: glycosyltransferase family 2 protein [Pseudomonadota bacterium]
MTERLTIVVPVFNERAVLPAFHERLCGVITEADVNAEVLYVDDGSTDGSRAWLELASESTTPVSILSLSRNFGKEVAMTAGLDHAEADAVVIIDADLQDPPELIPELVARWREGFDVVYARRDERQGETWLKRSSASVFYRVMDRLSDVPIPRDTGDFRLLSRRAVDELHKLREQHRYMKGLYAWIGLPQTSVTYTRAPRADGRSKLSYARLFDLAMEGITSFSAAPLRMATWLGLGTSFAAFAYGLFFFVRTLLLGNPVPGYPSLIVIILFLGGVQLVCLGIIGEYLARTYDESKRRPLYVIDQYRPWNLKSPNESTSPAPLETPAIDADD